MTLDALEQAVKNRDKISIVDQTSLVLWLAGTGQWDAAHDLVESLPEPAASWIHAMLHREKGDLSNAQYWYARANQATPVQSLSIQQEWKNIAQSLSS